MAQIRIYDAASCIGCRACEVACVSAHDGDGPYIWVEDFAAVNGGKGPVPFSSRPSSIIHPPSFLPVSCTHGPEAECVKACPTGAMHFDEANVVLVNPKICIGCKYCAMACPYGVVDYNPKLKVVQKCDLCAARRADGLGPACVATCPTGVIQLVDDLPR